MYCKDTCTYLDLVPRVPFGISSDELSASGPIFRNCFGISQLIYTSARYSLNCLRHPGRDFAFPDTNFVKGELKHSCNIPYT